MTMLELRKCNVCGKLVSTSINNNSLIECKECLEKTTGIVKIDVDKMSEDVNDKIKTRDFYIAPSKEWHIGHGLSEHV